MLGSLKYLADLPIYQSQKPFKILNFPDLDPETSTNCQYEEIDSVLFTDIRGREDEFSIDQCGFQVCRNHFDFAPTLEHFNDPQEKERAVQRYLGDVIAFVQRTMKSDKVICFDWRVSWR